MNSLSIEPHYLPNIEYFSLLCQADEIVWDLNSYYPKQTYCNRTQFLTSQGILSLTVPVHYKSQDKFSDITIDYHQNWIKNHWGALYSAYGKAPFFEYLYPFFLDVWNAHPQKLKDLNQKMLAVCFQLLQWEQRIVFEKRASSLNLCNQLNRKEPYTKRNFYQASPYPQIFNPTHFVPNLSIVDLLMNMGPQSGEIIKKSIKKRIFS